METLHKNNNYSLVGYFRDGGPLLSWASLITVFFFLFTFYSPSLLAVKLEVENHQQVEDIVIEGETAEEKMANTLQLIKLETNITEEEIEKRIEEEGNWLQALFSMIGVKQMKPTKLKKMEQLNENIEELHVEAIQGFNEVEQMLKDKELPEEIMQRHHDAVALYNAEYQTYQNKYKEVTDAKSLRKQDQAISELNEFLDSQQFKRSHQPFDPKSLPFGTPDSNVREPYTTKEEFQALLNEGQEQNLMPRIAETLTDALIDTAEAAHDEPQPEDLLPTIDVQITQPIIDLANQLNNNPVEIYNWVRNNIEFIPTYGSIQGSDMTLQTLRGNAFDTSSLLIALLRAANIPARYAMGTVEIPIDEVMNWVGGVEVPEASLQILGQGGIPNVGLTQGGVFKAVRMEHVWVEAFIDFEPSRGAKNIQGDSWIPMDGAFKQYAFDPPDFSLDDEIQDINVQSLLDSLVNSSTVDEINNSVEAVDVDLANSLINQIRDQVITSINNQIPNARARDVVAIKAIVESTSLSSASSLPYKLLIQANSQSILSDSVRHKYRLELINSFGNSVFSNIYSLPEITGKALSLSYRPKTDADLQLIKSLIPDNAINIGDLPNTLPGYLINIEAEFSIDSNLSLSGGTFKMGEDSIVKHGLFNPVTGWRDIQDSVVAGEYRSINIDPGTTGGESVLKAQERLISTISSLDNYISTQDETFLDSVDKHQIVGNMLHAGLTSYFAVSGAQDKATSLVTNSQIYRLPSFGSFFTSLKTNYSFGLIPRDVSVEGFLIDINLVQNIVETNESDAERRVSIVRYIGSNLSSYEHSIPEMMFELDTSQNEAVSAVKAITKSIVNGQKVYKLTSDNVNQLNNINVDNDVRTEIINSLNASQEVHVHENPITISGWTGTGYIILDPETGSGAYKISGGYNGGAFSPVDDTGNLLGAAFFIAGILEKTGILGVAQVLRNALFILPSCFENDDAFGFALDTILFLEMLAMTIATTLLMAMIGPGVFLIPLLFIVFFAAMTLISTNVIRESCSST